MIFLYAFGGSVVGTLFANACIVFFGVWLKNKKGGNWLCKTKIDMFVF